MHNMHAARHHMQHADLVLALGSSLTILANYFDPWEAQSKWARPPPTGVRLAPPRPTSGAVADGAVADGPAVRGKRAHGGVAASGKRPRAKAGGEGIPPPCGLAIVCQGNVMDQELARVKIDADCDTVMAKLLTALGLPEPPPYDAASDPLLAAATEPHEGEPAAPWRISRRAQAT